MFKSFKLKQMGQLAKQLVEANNDAFSKYDTEVKFQSVTKRLLVHRNTDRVEYIVPYAFLGSTQKGIEGRSKIGHIKEMTFCMNSIYEIARSKGIDPIELVSKVINDCVNDLRAGVYPDREFKLLYTA